MFRLISILLFKLKGWKIDPNFEPKNHKKFILVGGPHTSNWDVVYFLGALYHMNIKPRFLIKKDWMTFPFGLIFKPLGGLAIDRNPKDQESKSSTTSFMIDAFNNAEELIIAISPEGTRGYNPHWKKGFYHTAFEAGIPILLGYLDYKNRVSGISKTIIPSGDIEKDLKEINDFYSNYTGKNHEQFAPYQQS